MKPRAPHVPTYPVAYAISLTVPALATRSEEPPQIPTELQAAIDNGQEEEVKKLLDKAPDTQRGVLEHRLPVVGGLSISVSVPSHVGGV